MGKKTTDETSENTVVNEEMNDETEDMTEDSGMKESNDAISELFEEEIFSEKKNEEISSEEILKKNTSRFNARLEIMPKQKKKEIYASEHVYTEYGERDVETESTQKKAEYSELVASQKSQKILKGKITGLHYADENDPTSTILAEILYGKGYFDIVIPSYLLFDYELNEKYAKEKENEAIKFLITKRLNSNIDFVVHTIDKTGKVFADRLAALSMKGVNNYLPRGPLDARIQPGLLVEGNITMVSRTYVMVEALGAEMQIYQPELSWFHIGDAREEFAVGQKVLVRVLSIKDYKTSKYNNKYTLVDVKGSIRLATKDHRKEYFDSFRIGGRYAATVTYVEESVYVNLAGKMDAMVAFPKFGKNPVRGDERIVQITAKDESRLFIYGIFVSN